jgi:hypothetical protein
MSFFRLVKTLLLTSFFFTIFTQTVYAYGNNVIELRNDSSGSQYLNATLRYAAESPTAKYYLDSRNPDVWKGSSVNLNGKTIPQTALWTIKVDFSKSDGKTPGTNHSLLKDRNIPRNLNLNSSLLTPVTRNTNVTNVSKKFGDHQKDWDFLVDKKNQILSSAGLNDNSPDWDKAMAIAENVNSYGGGDQYFHPVDFFSYGGAYCTGKANTTVALAGLTGIPGRLVSWYNHTLAELYIDGEWRYTENYKPFMKNIDSGHEKGPVFSYNFLEMISDPAKFGMKNQSVYNTYYNNLYCGALADNTYLHYYLELYSNWIFHLQGTYPGEIKTEMKITPTSSYEIAALYPGQASTFKCKDVPSMWLTPYKIIKSSWTRKINQGNGIRQEFYLSSLSDVTKVQSVLLLKSGTSHSMPSNGGDWYYLVNGDKYYLKDNGGWSLKSNYEGTGYKYLTFDIPLKSLKTSGTNPTPTTTVSPGIPGDANGDEVVNIGDYVVWINNYNQNKFGPTYADFNNSGSVDGVDYIIWLNNYGKW